MSIRQFGFRFRNDDESETSATWKATQNTNITLPPGDPVRLRIGIDSTGDIGAKQFQLEYRKKPSGGAWGSWSKIS